jgi:hypothetical protein
MLDQFNYSLTIVCSVIRGCASDPDYKALDIVTPVHTGDQCTKSFCLGDLCNNEGLEKTGKAQ